MPSCHRAPGFSGDSLTAVDRLASLQDPESLESHEVEISQACDEDLYDDSSMMRLWINPMPCLAWLAPVLVLEPERMVRSASGFHRVGFWYEAGG